MQKADIRVALTINERIKLIKFLVVLLSLGQVCLPKKFLERIGCKATIMTVIMRPFEYISVFVCDAM